jgi:hypothetical protein
MFRVLGVDHLLAVFDKNSTFPHPDLCHEVCGITTGATADAQHDVFQRLLLGVLLCVHALVNVLDFCFIFLVAERKERPPLEVFLPIEFSLNKQEGRGIRTMTGFAIEM